MKPAREVWRAAGRSGRGLAVAAAALLLVVPAVRQGLAAVRSDSVVVFNEVMYHPAAADEGAAEWVELQNQMSVDVDVSRWRLEGGIEFEFPAGTIVPARGYRVVAAAPVDLEAGTGLTNVLGPFQGRLGNGGETLRLINNNGRVMDEIDYGTEDEWPVAPDGAGFSLARRRGFLPGVDPASWRASEWPGGSPGAENFRAVEPRTATNTLVAVDGSWRYDNSGLEAGAGWREPGFDDSGWAEGRGVFHHTTASLPAPKGTAIDPVRGVTRFRTQFEFAGDPIETQLRVCPVVDDGAVIYLNGTELARINMPEGPVTATTTAVVPVGDAVFGDVVSVSGVALRTGVNVLAVEVHQAGGVAAYPEAVLGAGPVGYWRCEEGSGSAGDSAAASGAPQSGAQNGVYTGFADGNLGQAGPRPTDTTGGHALTGFGGENRAVRFAGADEGGDDVVLVADPGVLSFASTRQFTIEAWVNASPAQEDGAPLVCRGTGGGGEQYCVDVYGGRYRFYVWTGEAANRAVVAQSGVGPDGTWQHVAGVFDGAAGRMALYVNAIEVGSASPPATLVDTPHPVSFGARQLSAGPYDLNLDGRLDEVALYPRALDAAEILAHFEAAHGVGGTSEPDTNDMAFGLALRGLEPVVSYGRSLDVVFNELAGAEESEFWVELVNRGRATADLAGCVVTRMGVGPEGRQTLPARLVEPNGFAVLTGDDLGFRIWGGDRLMLLAPGGSNLLDAVVATVATRARAPDGTGRWQAPAAPTPGASNRITIERGVVINELMFHPSGSGGGWIELYNRGPVAVDLSDWLLAGDIEYRFSSDRVLAPSGFIVVSEDPDALRRIEPGIDIVGPIRGTLPRRTGTVELRDALGNRVSAVRYFTGGRWPERAGGGGSSLELRDPRADPGAAEAWAASDESSRAAWQTFTWRGIAKPGQPGEPTLWHEFALCLVDGAGEALLDSLSVVESPSSNPRQLLPNGSFAGGSGAHWRFLGTHRHSRVEEDPERPGRHVLRLVATGYGEYQGNQIETTLANNAAVVDGREYEVSFRARWLGGKRRLNARLYFNRLARTVLLEAPDRCGTPGRMNSCFTANLGPTFADVEHAPTLPAPNQAVTVAADVSDPDGVSAATLWYAVDGDVWQSLPMSRNDSGAGTRVRASVPALSAGTVVQCYLEAVDSRGALGRFPAAGPESRMLYRVQDGQSRQAPPASFRVIMTGADAAFLHTPTNTLSNELLGATVVADEREVFYDVGVRLKGSFVGRNVPRVGFHVRFHPDRPFRGAHEKVAVDRSQHTLIGGAGELLVKHLAGYCGGIPNMYDDLAWFIAPLPAYTSMATLRMAGFDELYLDSQFWHGGDGPMHEPEVLRWNLATVDGNPESPKQVGNEGSGTGYRTYDLADYGEDLESYRWSFPLVDNRTADDLSVPMAVGKLFDPANLEFETNAVATLDVDEWLRVLAFQSLVGPSDAYYTGGTYHNYRLYRRPADGRVLYLPWDWDSCFSRATGAPLVGTGNVIRLLGPADHYRRYLGHLYDLIETGFNRAYLGRWAAHYGAVSAQDFAGILDYVDARASHVMGQLPIATPFAITNHGGSNFTVSSGGLALGGTAPIAVCRIEVNGQTHPVTWTSTSNWVVAVPLGTGMNALTVRGLDRGGAAVAEAVDSIIVINTGSSGDRPIVINEWLADNAGPNGIPDPADGRFQDWFELYNPNPTAVDLSGLHLTDDLERPLKWTIPPEVFIGPHGFLLVWADGDTGQNPVAGGTNVDLHASFQLDKDGDSIGLFAADAVTLVSAATFSRQIRNVSEGRYPDGDTDAVVAMPVWTPRAPNVATPIPAPRLWILTPVENGVTLLWSAVPGRVYQVEFKDDLAASAWTPLGLARRATGVTGSARDGLMGGVSTRFYRVCCLP